MVSLHHQADEAREEEEAVQKILERVDTDGSGEIEFDEFLVWKVCWVMEVVGAFVVRLLFWLIGELVGWSDGWMDLPLSASSRKGRFEE